ncbi:MAG: ABC transporter permease subunit [Treponema sp.]|jgi:putative aldouronate transport system permease protein|nr:ABC transporter permease subunit [Treponema sp.]
MVKKHKRKKISWELTLLAIPGLVFIFFFKIVPLYGLQIPFKDINYAKGIWGSPWIGLKNFEFFFRSQDAFRVTRNTLLFNFIFIVVGLIVSVTLALLLFELPRTQVKIYQTAMFIPYFLSWIVISYILYAILNPLMGLLPHFLKNFNMQAPNYYLESKYWIVILPICVLWKGIGSSTLLYYAALMSIDPNQFEAAAIDGANKLQITFRISIPYLGALITLLLILNIGNIFYSDFGMFYFLTRDSGPLYSLTDTIDTYVYRALRVTGDIGMSSAMGLYQSLVGFVLVLGTNLIVRKIRPESSIF